MIVSLTYLFNMLYLLAIRRCQYPLIIVLITTSRAMICTVFWLCNKHTYLVCAPPPHGTAICSSSIDCILDISFQYIVSMSNTKTLITFDHSELSLFPLFVQLLYLIARDGGAHNKYVCIALSKYSTGHKFWSSAKRYDQRVLRSSYSYQVQHIAN